jgi:hypothetical protein
MGRRGEKPKKSPPAASRGLRPRNHSRLLESAKMNKKEQKKKDREKRVAKKKLAAQKRAHEQQSKEPESTAFPKTKKVFSAQSSNLKTDFMANTKKPTHTHRRAGS